MTISPIQKSHNIPSSTSPIPEKGKTHLTSPSFIETAEQSPSPKPGLFSPPILLIIYLAEKTYTIGNSLLQSATDEIKYISETSKEKMAEFIEILKKALARAQDIGMWTIMQKVGTSIFAVTNLFIGFSAYSNSPELGTALIASGILSATNLLMTELKGWDQIADTLAQENVEFKQNLAFWSPIVLTSLSVALTTFSGPSVLFNSNLFPSSFSFNPNICLQMFKGVTTVGSSVTEAMFSWTQAHLSDIQNQIFLNLSLQEALAFLVQSFLKLFEYGREQASNIIQLTSQLRM